MSSIKKKQLSALDNASSLSDQELREALKLHGQAPGPITDSTRSLYRKKLASLLESKDVLDGVANEDDDDDTSDEDYEVDEEEDGDGDDISVEDEEDDVEDVDPEDLINDLNEDVTNLSSSLPNNAVVRPETVNRISRGILISISFFFIILFIFYLYLTDNLPRYRSLTKLVLSFIAISPIVYIIYKIFKFFKQRNDEESQRVCNLVNDALEILQSPDNPKGMMPILHIRDTLLTPAERKSKKYISLWQKAVKFMEEHESRVKVELVNIDGEDFRAWKWIGTSTTSSPRKLK